MSTAKTVTAQFENSTDNVILAISPDVVSVGIGQTFTVDLEVRSENQLVDAAAAFLSFDPTYFQVVRIDPGSHLGVVIENNYDNVNGEINYSAGTFTNFPSGTFTLATVTFIAGPETIASTELIFITAGTRKSDITFGGASVLEAVVDGSVTINNNASVLGHIVLEGRPTPPAPSWEIPLQVSLTVLGSTQPIYTFDTTTDDSGCFRLDGIAPGTYILRIKHYSTLANIKTISLQTGENPVELGTLSSGDANNDNTVNLVDFSILASTYGRCLGQSGYDARADFNGDTCISILDFSLLASHYGQSGDNNSAEASSIQENEYATILALTDSHEVITGSVFTVVIPVQADGLFVDGAQVNLKFDPSKMEILQVTPNNTLPIVLENHYDNSLGTLTYAAGTFDNLPSGTFTLLEIQFEAIASAPDTEISFEAGTDVTSRGASVLGEKQNVSFIIVNPRIFLPIIMSR